MATPLFLASSLLVIGAHAFTRFDTTCTLPSTKVSFVSSPDTRGTLDILWSCLFTLVACTWTIQHLNIPEQRDGEAERQDPLHQIWYTVKSWVKNFWSHFKWMLFTMLVPEFILGKAVGEFFMAREMSRKVQGMKNRQLMGEDEEWSLAHGFFAFMGGFRAKVSLEVVTATTERNDTEIKHQPSSGQERSPEQNGQRESEQDWGPDDLESVGAAGPGQLFIIPPDFILSIRRAGLIPKLPGITKEEIHDKSKANFLVKAIAAVQVFWVCVQVIVRSARGLAISQLELMVTAFSICAVITYIFLLQKPQNVEVPMRPIILPPTWISYRLDPLSEIDETKLLGWSQLRVFFIPGFGNSLKLAFGNVARIPNDSIIGAWKDHAVFALGMSVGSIIFGAVHVAGWNLKYPTPIEREMWRITSILSTCLVPVALLPYLLTAFSIYKPLVLYSNAWGLTFGVIYALARLFLLVEAFRSLAFLPPSVWVGTWVANIPSIN